MLDPSAVAVFADGAAPAAPPECAHPEPQGGSFWSFTVSACFAVLDKVYQLALSNQLLLSATCYLCVFRLLHLAG